MTGNEGRHATGDIAVTHAFNLWAIRTPAVCVAALRIAHHENKLFWWDLAELLADQLHFRTDLLSRARSRLRQDSAANTEGRKPNGSFWQPVNPPC